MTKEREKIYKECFNVSEIPKPGSPESMNVEKFKQLPKQTRENYIIAERDLLFMEQVELSRNMIDFAPVLDGYYATIAL